MVDLIKLALELVKKLWKWLSPTKAGQIAKARNKIFKSRSDLAKNPSKRPPSDVFK